MKKIVFTNKVFYCLLLAYIFLMLSYNSYVTIKDSNALGIVPISIQIVLIILILMQIKYVKVLLMIWSGVFLIGGYGLHILGDVMQGFGNNFSTLNLDSFLYFLVSLAIGLLIFDFTRRTVVLDLPPKYISETEGGDEA